MKEKQLEDALRAWPLADVPKGFSASVMENIRPRQADVRIAQQIQLKFRLTWMDYALGLFLSLIPALIFIAYISLPRKFILFVEYQWLVLQFPGYGPVLFIFVGGMALTSLLVLVFSLRYLLPRQVSLYY
jgi:hypothetical protein